MRHTTCSIGMQVAVAAAVAVCLCLLHLPSTAAGSTTPNITISGRQVMVDGKRFFMRGAAYNPVPVGYSSGFDWYLNGTLLQTQLWQRDVANLKSMYANTVRIYSWDRTANHTAFLNGMQQAGIYVVVQFQIWPANCNLSSPTVISDIKSKFQTMITNNQHPNILYWLIHNEVNAAFSSQLPAFFSLLSELRAIVTQVEGPQARPVTTTLADSSTLFNIITTYDSYVPFWNLQIYRGRTFGTLFSKYASASSKPFFISEFGIDAFDNVTGKVNETAQQSFFTSLWTEVVLNNNTVSGGAVFAYVDGLWKCGGNLSTYSPCGFNNGNFPDKFSNEEYYGMFVPTHVDYQVDKLTPRLIVSSATAMWSELANQTQTFNTSASTQDPVSSAANPMFSIPTTSYMALFTAVALLLHLFVSSSTLLH